MFVIMHSSGLWYWTTKQRNQIKISTSKVKVSEESSIPLLRYWTLNTALFGPQWSWSDRQSCRKVVRGLSSWRHCWLTVKVQEFELFLLAWGGRGFATFEQKSKGFGAAINRRNDSKSKVSTFEFTKDPKLQKEWLIKMKRLIFRVYKALTLVFNCFREAKDQMSKFWFIWLLKSHFGENLLPAAVSAPAIAICWKSPITTVDMKVESSIYCSLQRVLSRSTRWELSPPWSLPQKNFNKKNDTNHWSHRRKVIIAYWLAPQAIQVVVIIAEFQFCLVFSPPTRRFLGFIFTIILAYFNTSVLGPSWILITDAFNLMTV